MWTILITDDDHLVRWSLSQAMRRRFLVFTAEDADVALDILKRAHVDALVTDLRMPGRDGIELAEIVRRVHPHVLVFVLTAYGSDAVFRHLAELGVRACFGKPFDVAGIVAAIERHLEAASLTPAGTS